MPETMDFRTELKQLLHLITHSLYSDRDIFLRELISNASDAVNKARFDSLDNAEALGDDRDWKIRLTPDKTAGTLTISDNGIGMTREGVIDQLGTIAKSGTRAFMDRLKQQPAGNAPDLIGQFGVGFYSAFMVADKVTVVTRALNATEAVKWESDGQGAFTVDTADKPTRGTDVTLHVKEDAKSYLDSWKLRQLVHKYSEFIEHPIVTAVEHKEGDVTTTADETLNAQKALWLRSKSEITADEYNAFYKQLANDDTPPAKTLHYGTEGKLEYKALLFLPAKKPFDYRWEEPQGVRLYIQRVLIMEKCEALLPAYLRFIRGIVDSADLPLNISRELLQENPLLDRIRKSLVSNILEAMEGMKNVERENYVAFFREFGVMLKEGLTRDFANQSKLADLLLFESMNTPANEFVSLGDYVEKLAEGQDEILYLIGDTRQMLENSPLLEQPRSQGKNVLFLLDSIDEFMLPNIRDFKGKKLVALDRLPTTAPVDAPETEAFTPLLGHLKALLPDVKEIRLSTRLQESASVLIADEHGMSANMERLMRKLDRTDDLGDTRRILELNPKHPAVLAMKERFTAKADDARVVDYARLLLDQATLAEGSKLTDPAGFAQRINALISRDATL